MQQYINQVKNLTNAELNKSGVKSETVDALEKILKSLDSISKSQSNITPSEVLKYLEANPYVDINGSSCPVYSSSISADSLSITYFDPGDWEEPDYDEDRSEEELSYDSRKHLEDFLKKSCLGARVKVEVGTDYHLAEVESNIVFY